MSYRSIKRVLGENSLERKCRILFGICMFLLIGGSFFLVMRLTEDFIRDDTREKAKEIMAMRLLKVHLQSMQFTVEDEHNILHGVANELAPVDYPVTNLVLEGPLERDNAPAVVATDPEEREIIEALVRDHRERQAAEHTKTFSEDLTENVDPKMLTDNAIIPAMFRDRFAADDRYQFYQAIIFKSNCRTCHFPVKRNEDGTLTGVEPVEQEPGVSIAPLPPMYVLRLTLPYAKANEGIYRSRAILLALAIVTTFVATAALYAIMRYVIVKPLKHLQSVIQEISKGKMEVRSALNTGDEFEELSKSLNRMLRHLADSQAALTDANADLDRKVDEQAQLTMKLYQTNQIKSDFLANMSHELRTPLNSIIGFSEVLSSIGSLNEKQQGYASNIRKSGHALLDLINNILELAKLEAGKTEIHAEEFSLELLANDLHEMVRPLAEKKRIEMQLRIDPALPQAYQDQGKIRQVLTNLLSNAIKFTPEGGRIYTHIGCEGDQLVVKVRDSGVGIAEEDRRIIFEKFRQAPSTIGVDSFTRRHSGTGLGLSIVKELCILLGGEIDVQSEVGKGSIFTVRLPLQQQSVPATSSEFLEQIERLNHKSANLSGHHPGPVPSDGGGSIDPTGPGEATSAST